MTTPETPGPAHPWRADRTWTQDGVLIASTHTWATEHDARTGAARLAQGRDLPAGVGDVEVALSRWDRQVRGWRNADPAPPARRTA